MDPKLPGFIAAGRHHTPFIPAHQYGFSLQGRIVPDLNGHEKRVEVKMGDMSYFVFRHSPKLLKAI